MLDYAAAPPSVGQSGPDLYMGGVNLSLQSSTEGGATTPHCDGACGFLKFWSINLTGNCSGGACSSPGQSRLFCLLAVLGDNSTYRP